MKKSKLVRKFRIFLLDVWAPDNRQAYRNLFEHGGDDDTSGDEDLVSQELIETVAEERVAALLENKYFEKLIQFTTWNHEINGHPFLQWVILNYCLKLIVPIVKKLIQTGFFDINQQDIWGRTIFHECMDKDADLAEYVMHLPNFDWDLNINMPYRVFPVSHTVPHEKYAFQTTNALHGYRGKFQGTVASILSDPRTKREVVIDELFRTMSETDREYHSMPRRCFLELVHEKRKDIDMGKLRSQKHDGKNLMHLAIQNDVVYFATEVLLEHYPTLLEIEDDSHLLPTEFLTFIKTRTEQFHLVFDKVRALYSDKPHLIRFPADMWKMALTGVEERFTEYDYVTSPWGRRDGEALKFLKSKNAYGFYAMKKGSCPDLWSSMANACHEYIPITYSCECLLICVSKSYKATVFRKCAPVQFFGICEFVQQGYVRISPKKVSAQEFCVWRLKKYSDAFSFLDIMIKLPTEIQMMICHYASCHHDGVKTTKLYAWPKSPSMGISSELIMHERIRFIKFLKSLKKGK